ncbi:MAG: response regulator [Prolixibacteraceae bacterium]|jgi:PAS domain S-box-containing protein
MQETNPTLKILVIDDNESNLLLVRSIFKKSHPDFEILTSLSGKAGIEIAREQIPQTILLDIFMPEMDGYETCRILKSSPKTSSIPILMISADGQNAETRLDGLKAGADAIMSKPFKQEEFIALVNVMLRIKKAEDTLRRQNQELEIYIKKQIREFNFSEERFLQISGYALEFFWEMNSMGLVTYISPIIDTVLGYKDEEITGKLYFFPLSSESKKQTFVKFIKGNMKFDKAFKNEQLIFRHRNGEKVWMSASGFPLFNNANELIGYRGICQDISVRVRAEKSLQKSLEQIKEYQVKLKRLNSELSITEERERRKIAEFLHDGISQILSLANIKLSTIPASDQNLKTIQTITESIELINNAISQTRWLTYDLSPPILYELGLIPAIKWKLEQIENKYGISTLLKSNVEKIILNTDVRILVFRIISELLNNVIKHANANLIDIDVSIEQKTMYISVVDNGKGFNFRKITKSTNQSGFGLFSIKERLDSIHGTLYFESGKLAGTKAVVQIPI